jgi:hypothetical protein
MMLTHGLKSGIKNIADKVGGHRPLAELCMDLVQLTPHMGNRDSGYLSSVLFRHR